MGSITVDVPHASAGVRTSVSLKDLLDGSRRFYGKEKTREERELAQIGITPQTPDVHLHDRDANFLLRIGRHSGAESVTIEGQRQIRIKQEGAHSKTLEYATTFWLAAETRKPKLKEHLLPFGWAVLAPLTADSRIVWKRTRSCGKTCVKKRRSCEKHEFRK